MRIIMPMIIGLLLLVTVGNALSASKGTQDIVDLQAQKNIAVKAQGDGIDRVSLALRRLGSEEVTVRIPVGTFFVSRQASAQNMLTTAERTVVLRNQDWVSVSIPAACANRPRDIPTEQNTFSIRRAPAQQDLQRVMPILERASASRAVRQAAVWIVTDNADYDDLGILVQGYGPLAVGGTRVIDEEATVAAMQILDQAGINIRRKAIWRDRHALLKGLQNTGLKQWLRDRARR